MGYLVPVRDTPRAGPNGERSWETAAAAAAAAVVVVVVVVVAAAADAADADAEAGSAQLLIAGRVAGLLGAQIVRCSSRR